MSKSDPFAPKSRRPVILDSAPVVEKEEEPKSDVPSGTVNEVLGWVGDDKERAQAALDAEKDGAGRKTLVSQLEELLSE